MTALEGRPVLRADWPANDLVAGAETTRAALAELGVPTERPRDVDMLIERLGRGVGPGASPDVGRDLVARRLVAAANHALSRRADPRRFTRVVAIRDEPIAIPTWVLVDERERIALAAEGVELEALGRMVAARLAPIVLGLVTIVLAIVALATGDRRVWIAAFIAWGVWLVARIAGRRAVVPRPRRPSRA